MKKSVCLVFVGLGLLCTAAKGGCSAEATNDGSSDAWPTAAAPVAGHAQPMSCAFLAGDNCWKRLVAKVEACAGDVRTDGKLDAAREVCSAASGAKLQLGGAVDTPAAGTTSVVATDWRLLDAHGATCATGKILGVGRTLLDVQGEVAVFESTSLLGYRLTCPDGSTYTNEDATSSGGVTIGDPDGGADGGGVSDGSDGNRVCSSFGLEYLQHRAPGLLLACDGTTRDCSLDAWGGAAGQVRFASCAW